MTEADMIRRASSARVKKMAERVTALIKRNPEITMGELQTATGWSEAQISNVVTYMQMVNA